MSAALSRDPTRYELPFGAGTGATVSTVWAQTALRSSGVALAVDGRAGPETMRALAAFAARNAPQDPAPVTDPSSPDERYPARVIMGVATERALAAAMLSPVPARPTPSGQQGDRLIIGPNLDPQPLPTAPSRGPGAMSLVLGGLALLALGGAAYAATRAVRARRGSRSMTRRRARRGRRRRR